MIVKDRLGAPARIDRASERQTRCVINSRGRDVILMGRKHNGARLTSRQAVPETPDRGINFACDFIIQPSYATMEPHRTIPFFLPSARAA